MSAAVILSPTLCTYDNYSNKKVQEFPSVHGDIAIIHPVRRIDIIGNLGMPSGC